MIEGSRSGSRAWSGSGSIPLTSGSGSGSGRPKNMWIRWIRIRIRIRNTAWRYNRHWAAFICSGNSCRWAGLKLINAAPHFLVLVQRWGPSWIWTQGCRTAARRTNHLATPHPHWEICRGVLYGSCLRMAGRPLDIPLSSLYILFARWLRPCLDQPHSSLLLSVMVFIHLLSVQWIWRNSHRSLLFFKHVLCIKYICASPLTPRFPLPPLSLRKICKGGRDCMNDLYYISPEWKGKFISAVFAYDTRFIIYFIYPVLQYCILSRCKTRKWIIDVTNSKLFWGQRLNTVILVILGSSLPQRNNVFSKCAFTGSMFCSVLVPDLHFCGPWIQTVIHSGNPDLDPARIQKQ